MNTIAKRLGLGLGVKHAPATLSRFAPCRLLHLAPPFLLDDYVPRYQRLSSRDEARKRSAAYAHLRNCNLCPRLCGVNRYETTGMCLVGHKAKVNVIAPHFGEGLCNQHRSIAYPRSISPLCGNGVCLLR